MTGLFLLSADSFAQSSNLIIGKWQNTNDSLFQIEIFLARNGYYYGKVLNDQKQVQNNGKIILQKLRYDSSQKTYSGLMMPPDANITINAEIRLLPSNKIKLKISKSIISKTMYLIKIQ